MRFLLLSLLILLGSAGIVRAEPIDAAALEEVIDLLHERGLIDGDDRERILAKHHAERDSALPAVSTSLLEGWQWNGDLRLRYEGFWYDSDGLGVERHNRHRFRYRARLGFRKRINERLAVGMRVASGDGDPRSRNRTLGDDEDFDPDELYIDTAWADVLVCRCEGAETRLLAGKISNPFRWKETPDLLLWDSDITPEGAALVTSYPISEDTRLFAKLGGFIVDENNASNDPKVFALQFGGTTQLRKGLRAGMRASGYEWRTLDGDFITRAGGSGNLLSAFDGRARIGELTGFLSFEAQADWPFLVFGTVARNFTADRAVLSGFAVDKEDLAWGAGFEVGDKKRIVQFGWGYYYVEANSLVALTTDSDLLDGRTNQRGWTFHATRSLWDGVDFKIEYFDGDSIKNTGRAAGPFAGSISDADRKRFRTDIVVSF